MSVKNTKRIDILVARVLIILHCHKRHFCCILSRYYAFCALVSKVSPYNTHKVAEANKIIKFINSQRVD